MHRDRPRTSDLPWSVFPRKHPRTFGYGLLSDVLRKHLRVPHTSDRRADRWEHRLPVGAFRLAFDLAVRLDAIRATRTERRDRVEALRVELHADLLAGLQAHARGERVRRGAAGHAAAACE